MTGGSWRNGRVGACERWVTARGAITGAELDAACERMGVALGRERRRLWQRSGLFPLPAHRWSEPGSAESRPGAYHPGAPWLAAFLDTRVVGSGRGGDLVSVRDAVRLLRIRAGDLPGADGGEDRFYALVQDALEGLRSRRGPTSAAPQAGEAAGRRRDTGTPVPEPPRWTTAAGTLTAAELEAACRDKGVHLDRARRTYWQSERAFPQPERRRLRPPEGRGGARGYYHAGAVDLACLVDYAVRADHIAKSGSWRCSARELAHVLADWRAQVPDDEFYERIAEMIPLIDAGRPIPGVGGRHRDVLPAGQRRLDETERQTALRTTARVAEAIVDGWVAEHMPAVVPERLVVWFRLERAGPETWRIADAGARPTSHERQRAQNGNEESQAG